MREVKLEASWLAKLEKEFDKPYMESLRSFLVSEKQAGQVVYPPGNLIFSAFDSTPFEQLKVVILGQDPY